MAADYDCQLTTQLMFPISSLPARSPPRSFLYQTCQLYLLYLTHCGLCTYSKLIRTLDLCQLTCPTNGSNGHRRLFCLFQTAAQLLLFCIRLAGYKFSDIHTYLHSHYNQWLKCKIRGRGTLHSGSPPSTMVVCLSLAL